MSRQFQFSHTKNKQDLLFFRKSKGAPPPPSSLKPITEQPDEAEQHSKTHRNVVIEVKDRLDHGLQQKCWKKYINCLIKFWRWCFLSERKWNYDLNNKDLESLIDKIKTKTCKFRTVLPPQKIPKKILVLDLDETLVWSTFTKPPKFDFEVQFKMQGRNMRAYTVKRFGLEVFLYEMAQLYEIVIFTACNQEYACKVLQKIDPEGLISHRLFRQDGITVNGNTFLKNIAVLGRDPHSTILVDDSRFSGMLQPDNHYQIKTFKGHQKDNKLLHLANFLRFAHILQRVTPIKDNKAIFEAQQIKIDPPQQQYPSEPYPPHPSDHSEEIRSHLQKKPSIDAQNWQTDFQSEGETTVANLIKHF